MVWRLDILPFSYPGSFIAPALLQVYLYLSLLPNYTLSSFVCLREIASILAVDLPQSGSPFIPGSRLWWNANGWPLWPDVNLRNCHSLFWFFVSDKNRQSLFFYDLCFYLSHVPRALAICVCL